MYLRSALQVKVSCHPSWQLLPATFPFFFKPPFSPCDFLVNPLSLLPSCESGEGLGIQEKKGNQSFWLFFHIYFPSPELSRLLNSGLLIYLPTLPLNYIFPLIYVFPPLPLIISSFPPNPLPNFASSYQKTCLGNEMMQEKPPLLQESEIGPPPKKIILVYFKSRHILLIDLRERKKKVKAQKSDSGMSTFRDAPRIPLSQRRRVQRSAEASLLLAWCVRNVKS